MVPPVNGPCKSCGRPFSPYHDSEAPGPTLRHPYIPRTERLDEHPPGPSSEDEVRPSRPGGLKHGAVAAVLCGCGFHVQTKDRWAVQGLWSDHLRECREVVGNAGT